MRGIELERLTCESIGDAPPVGPIDLFVPEGEWFVLAGPPDSGQSGVLDLIAGVRAPSSGRVRLDGCDVTEDLSDRRGLRLIRSDERDVEPYGRLRFEWMWQRETPAGPLRPRVYEQLLAALGEVPAGRRTPVLVDEPLAGVGPGARARARVELLSRHREHPRIVVHATSVSEDALAMGHRIGVLTQGRLAQIGTPLEVYERPATLDVARFVGGYSMNLFDGIVELRDRTPWFVSKRQAITPLPFAAAPLLGQPMTLGVRPEDVQLVDDGGDLLATLTVVQPDGPRQIVDAGLGGGMHLTACLPARPLQAAGRRVSLRFNPTGLHLFNADGLRYAALDLIPSA